MVLLDLPGGKLEQVGATAARDSGVEASLLGGYVPAVVASARAGRRLGRRHLDACREMGGAAADRGVALSALLDLYLDATWRLWEVVGTRAGTASASLLVGVAGAFLRAADDAAAALAQGYEAAQRRSIRQEEAIRREFVDELLAGRVEGDLLAEQAGRLGFNLAGAHLVVVARTHRPLVDAGPVQSRVETRVLARFRSGDAIVATKDGLLVCILPADAGNPAEDLQGALADTGEGPWVLGLGRVHPGPGGVVRSFGEARAALELGDRLGAEHPVRRFDEFLPYRVLTADGALSRELVEGILAPLEAARGGAAPLLETLEAFFAEAGNVSATARRLHLSPRAVVYRLDRITALTGRAPQEPEDRFVLEMALRLRRLL